MQMTAIKSKVAPADPAITGINIPPFRMDESKLHGAMKVVHLEFC